MNDENRNPVVAPVADCRWSAGSGREIPFIRSAANMKLYLVKMTSKDADEYFYKIGVTNHENPSNRFSFGKEKISDSTLTLGEIFSRLLSGERYISDHPYIVEMLHNVSYKYEGDARLGEQALLEFLKPNQYWPKKKFSGNSECFKGDELNSLIVTRMEEDSKARNSAAPDELSYMLHATCTKERDPIKRHLLILKKCKRG